MLASQQHGVVSREQLRALGLSSQAVYRRLQKRCLIRLHPGVYAVGHLALSSRWRDFAAVLACGPDALLSHRSAADLWGIRRTSSPRIEVTAPRGRKGPAGITVHRSRVVHFDDRTAVDAIAVTSVARTLADLADVLSLPALERAINEAERSACSIWRRSSALSSGCPTAAGEVGSAVPWPSISRAPPSHAARVSATSFGSAPTTACRSPAPIWRSRARRWT